MTQRIGSGNYGEAYLGHNITSLEQFVFKLYRFGKRTKKKMMREILVTQSLCGHPNIIKLHHIVKQSLTNYPVLVFEHVNNTSADISAFYASLTPEDVRYYAHELLKGLMRTRAASFTRTSSLKTSSSIITRGC